ncbi:MAG: hypothetical protein U5K72_11095 [Balneolaceae bacterium]|nr:hypothetical protein [Balneolaceae bacterium]
MEYILLESKQKEENLQTVFALYIQLVLYFTGSTLPIEFLGWRFLLADKASAVWFSGKLF